MQDMKAESKGASPLSAGDVTNDLSHVRKIIVACDAGMGCLLYTSNGGCHRQPENHDMEPLRSVADRH